MVVKDYYRILGVESEAGNEEIKKAYRRLAKSCHPDARPAGDRAVAQEKFKEITEAYEVLKDPERRKKYDQMNTIGRGASGVYQPVDITDEGEKEHEEAVREDVSGSTQHEKEKKTEESTMKQSQREEAGSRVVDLVVSFETAVRGGKQFITVPVEEECQKCKGTGARTKKDVVVCRGCGGSGFVYGLGSSVGEGKKCPRCGGEGKLIKQRCTRCQGSGRSRKDEKIAVQVPAGVEDGARMMLKELVGPDDQSDTNGIRVQFKISEHPYFHRDGINVVCEAPISVGQAILGAEIAVRTAMGKRITLKIPAGTDSGTIFRIKNEGIAKDGKQGHQLVKVKIVTPKRLSDKAKEHLELFLREVQSKLR